jgi:hypothetical protein
MKIQFLSASTYENPATINYFSTEKKQLLKEELLRMKEEENLNLSSYMVKLIENDIGFLVSQRFKQSTTNFS